MENVHERIEPDVVIRRIEPHGLLAHGRLQCISRPLVVVRKGNNRRADTEHHRGVDFTMGVVLQQDVASLKRLHVHGYKLSLFLLNIKQFDAPQFKQVPPVLYVATEELVPREFDLVVRDAKKRPHAAASVSEDADFLVDVVQVDRHFDIYVALLNRPVLFELAEELLGFLGEANPVAVDEDLGHSGDLLRADFLVEHLEREDFLVCLHEQPLEIFLVILVEVL